MLENKGKSPYHHAPHAWRFAFCPPIPDSPQAATAIPPVKRKNNKGNTDHHISIITKALNSYNKANGDLDYEFVGGTRISTIDEFGSTYHHCNFLVFSPTTRTIHLFFAEFDANTQDERGVHAFCPILLRRKEFGICYGCGLVHPRTEDYVAGRSNIWTHYGEEEEDFDSRISVYSFSNMSTYFMFWSVF